MEPKERFNLIKSEIRKLIKSHGLKLLLEALIEELEPREDEEYLRKVVVSLTSSLVEYENRYDKDEEKE